MQKKTQTNKQALGFKLKDIQILPYSSSILSSQFSSELLFCLKEKFDLQLAVQKQFKKTQ